MSISKIDLATDEEFILAYNQSSNYTDIARSLGYGTYINVSARRKIKDRIQQLGLSLYQSKLELTGATKGELFNTRANYQSARSSIRKHAQQIFENSDKEKCCAICGYDKHYEIAHIKPVSDFEDDALITEINSIDNLIALCPNHHWEVDNGLLNIGI